MLMYTSLNIKHMRMSNLVRIMRQKSQFSVIECQHNKKNCFKEKIMSLTAKISTSNTSHQVPQAHTNKMRILHDLHKMCILVLVTQLQKHYTTVYCNYMSFYTLNGEIVFKKVVGWFWHNKNEGFLLWNRREL